MKIRDKSIPMISYKQLAAVIIVCRIFTLMTHVPLIRQGYSAAVQISAEAVSALIQAVMLIPAVIFYSKDRHDPAERAFVLGKVWGYAVSAVYLIYFTVTAAMNGGIFTDFLRSRFSESVTGAAAAVLLVIVCFYCAYCGIEGIARASAAVLILFIIMTIVMVTGGIDKMQTENLRTDFSGSLFLNALTEDISRCTETALLCFAGKYTADRFRCGAYYSVCGKLLCTVFVTFVSLLVLGDYAYMSLYPYLDIGSSAGVRFLQRIDAVYMIVWVLTAVIFISTEIFFSASVLETAFHFRRSTACITVSVIVMLLLLAGIYASAEQIYESIASLPLQLAAVTLIPLIILIAERWGSREKKKA